ncbi:MAG TPA: glycosyltransferase family 2 protein [Rariglobus sp.]|jgi:glycosyltransferase involved in cell wall biosynthesis|nr:glycosyltransferase family 2 protein [Rariglobus sp.]
MFSIVILTLNEGQNLPACLASTAGCDDVVVLDSGSTDGTTEIARAAGARVFVNRFENFAQQRNHAHEAIPFRHEWVFHLDADETLTPELIAECAVCAGSAEALTHDGFFAAPKMFFRGCWIPHCTDYPAWQARFVHVRRFRFMQAGHGQREAMGMRMGRLQHPYNHNLSSQSEDDIRAKHIRYAQAEAGTFLDTRRSVKELFRALFSHDSLTRRRALKETSYYLPCRGALRMLYQYVWRRGFLDGPAGLAYCRLLADYERAIAARIRQLQEHK